MHKNSSNKKVQQYGATISVLHIMKFELETATEYKKKLNRTGPRLQGRRVALF